MLDGKEPEVKETINFGDIMENAEKPPDLTNEDCQKIFDRCLKDYHECEAEREECLMNVPISDDDLRNYKWEWLDPSEYNNPGMRDEYGDEKDEEG